MRIGSVMNEKINVVDFTINDEQCIVVSSPYYYNYYYSNKNDDDDNEDDYADNIRRSTGTKSRTGTTSMKFKDVKAKLTDD
eukprot:10797572-Heterocapsa_arctica.AAC.1